MCPAIRKKFSLWAIKFTVLHIVITALLMLLKSIFPCLPKHAKNLLETDNLYKTERFFLKNANDESEFVYIGLAEQLKRIVNPRNHMNNHLKLKFNVDGLPLFKTGGIEFWPIVGI